MGAVAGLIGGGGGAAGTSFAAPGQANLMQTVQSGALSQAAQGTQDAMGSQQALLQALQQQNGIQNQSNSYNQLQGIANGTGPNPAQTQYNQNINSLAQQQAGAIASQKGISPALQARMISQQGSAAMQNAAGQSATNMANQQLGAINSAAGIAGQQASNQIGQTNANTSAQQANQQNLLNAAGQYNNALVGGQSSVNSANAGLSQTQMQGQQGLIGGVMNGVGSIFADGGQVDPIVPGAPVAPAAPGAQPAVPQSKFGKFLKGMATPMQQPGQSPGAAPTTGPGALQQGMASLISGAFGKKKPAGPDLPTGSIAGPDSVAAPQSPVPTAISADPTMYAARGGKVPAMVSPGEGWLPPKKVAEVVKGKNPMSVAEKIPGKPKVPGNSYANDVVPKKLDVGGIVIPNSIMQSKDPARGAADFVNKIIAKRKIKR